MVKRLKKPGLPATDQGFGPASKVPLNRADAELEKMTREQERMKKLKEKK